MSSTAVTQRPGSATGIRSLVRPALERPGNTSTALTRNEPSPNQHGVRMQERVSGVVKWFNPRKGYGFITRPDEPDIFVHYSQITADGFRLLEDGQRVEFTLADGEKGRHAVDVVAVE